MDNSKHGETGHRCPARVLGEEECVLVNRWADDLEKFGPYDVDDPTFWVHHRQEDRWVKFNYLTSTLDDIITQCGYPESERERLAYSHRRGTEEYLKYYRGRIEGRVPLLSEIRPSTSAATG